MKNKIIFVIILLILSGIGIYNFRTYSKTPYQQNSDITSENQGGLEKQIHPLSIEALRQGDYPGSNIQIEQELTPGTNYKKYIASYHSEGLKIFALLTIPSGNKPSSGWPVIIFNHGYIPPKEYKTTERYVAYVDGFASNGYIVFKSDYRGHGNSEGNAQGGYGSNNYTIDILNAVSSVKKYPDADPDRIGMWGHSMGGFITLRNMVTTKDVKAGVIWAGVVASYPDLINNWRRRNSTSPPQISPRPGSWRDELISQYGSPETNSQFWNSLSANNYLSDNSGPLQLHHGTSDTSVPIQFSEKLKTKLEGANKEVELFTYPNDDHNLSLNFSLAMQRSIAFFDKYLLKGGETI